MPRTPDAVAVASLDTHRLIVTVPNDGPADVASNLPRPVAADVLRQIADQLDRAPRSCGRARATGEPCPVHDRHLAGTAPRLTSAERRFLTFALDRAADAMRYAGNATEADEAALARLRDLAEIDHSTGTAPDRPAGLDALLDHVAAGLPIDEPHGHNVDEHQANGEQPTDWGDDVRSALEFNESAAHPVLITVRDVLLDTEPRTPEQALAAARVLLAAHARELAEQADKQTTQRGDEMRERGDRSRVAYCGGMRSVAQLLKANARELDEQSRQ